MEKDEQDEEDQVREDGGDVDRQVFGNVINWTGDCCRERSDVEDDNGAEAAYRCECKGSARIKSRIFPRIMRNVCVDSKECVCSFFI